MVTVKRITKEHVADWTARKTTPPPPFTPAPKHLTPFTTLLDPTKVYITHIDRHPAAFKKQIFLVPVVLNLFIAAMLVWRATAILPWYIELLQFVLGGRSALTVDTAAHTWRSLAWLGLTRGLTLTLDFVLLRFVAAWPWGFFFERPCNPVTWRWRVGFQAEEVVVRDSRRWGSKELVEGNKVGGESPFFKTRIAPAVDRRLTREKTGYMMMNADWDLDTYAMVEGHRLVDEGKMKLADFEKTVLVHKEGLGWLAWRNHEEETEMTEEEQKKKIMLLKDRLTAMGKESLFFRWIEIVQYESGKPGEFDLKRQQETVEILKSEFAKQGVDFDKLVQDVGGLDGAPGMEN